MFIPQGKQQHNTNEYRFTSGRTRQYVTLVWKRITAKLL